MNLQSRRKNPGLRLFNGQAVIEFTAAFIVSVLLILAITKLFVWLNLCIADRQTQYQASRSSQVTFQTWKDPLNSKRKKIQATANTNFYTPPKLNLLTNN